MTSKANPILFIVAAILATFSLSRAESPEYFSAVTVELKETRREAVLGKLNAIAKQDGNVQIKQRPKTSLWEIGVYDTDPNRAAEKANRIAIDVRDAVISEFRKAPDAELEQLKLQLQRLRAELEKNTTEQLRQEVRAAEQKYVTARVDNMGSAVIPLVIWQRAVPPINPISPDVKR